MKHGENRLTLRVEDRQDPQQPRGKQSVSGEPHDIDYYCTTGVWQTVWLEPAPAVRIGEIKITPSARKSQVEIMSYLHAPAALRRMEVEVFDGGELVTSVEEETTAATCQVSLHIPGAKLWSPDAPHLYDLRLRLYEDGELLDEVTSYFGLRDVELREGRVQLNGEPIYLAMVLETQGRRLMG